MSCFTWVTWICHWVITVGEADLVTAHVDRLISVGVSPQDIAVIAPYNLQVTTVELL